MSTQKKLPSHKQCLNWIQEKNPANIVQHSLQVNKVAMFLGKKLQEKGQKIDLELLDRASLLHDLDKFETLKTGNHGFTAGKWLRKKGFKRIAEVIEHHLTNRILDSDFNEWPWEDKLVNYSDRRIVHTKIASLKERFAYLIQTYGTTPERKNTLKKAGQKFLKFETQLKKILKSSLSSNQLKKQI
ncbi:MAG: HD domain-containing protein [Candidatus Diapherotrites archaeon]|nr:HD domain-containing protein [Candidatus Diapherotrites archaeon]